jgi:integrase
METKALGEQKVARKVVFHRVAENLYRLETSGGYYALVKRGDKQFRRSLKTKDRKLAERRLKEYRDQLLNLRVTEDARLSFADVAKHWMAVTSHTLKPSSALRREQCIQTLIPFFEGFSIRNIQRQHCERWLTERAPNVAAMTMNRELELMRAVFAYAVKLGLMLKNPAEDIERRRVVQAKIQIPTREQFKKLTAAIRESDGREGSKIKAKFGADLVELLAYSGCRLAEATSLKWEDIDFEKSTIRITGGEGGTKNHESRTIPMTSALFLHLQRLRTQVTPLPRDFVSHINSAKKCLSTACRRLGYPNFTHHDFRHFFATTCIESGVDIPTVSRWLGHKDGGALAMRVYGHLRQEHSNSMIQRVTF